MWVIRKQWTGAQRLRPVILTSVTGDRAEPEFFHPRDRVWCAFDAVVDRAVISHCGRVSRCNCAHPRGDTCNADAW